MQSNVTRCMELQIFSILWIVCEQTEMRMNYLESVLLVLLCYVMLILLIDSTPLQYPYYLAMASISAQFLF